MSSSVDLAQHSPSPDTMDDPTASIAEPTAEQLRLAYRVAVRTILNFRRSRGD